MKKFVNILLVLAAVVSLNTSCQKEDTPNENITIIVADQHEKTPFDYWLDQNFVYPYNINFQYRYEVTESSLSYYTVPADYEQSIKLAHIVKYTCIDAYDEVAGIEFTRMFFPKHFFLIGEWEYKNNGTFILGTAEGGKKILLAGVNYLNEHLAGGASSLNHYYLKTIHHEFTHILNQTKDFPVTFSQITPTLYIVDDWSSTSENCYENGFISRYARHSDREDFAEMLSIYVTNTQETWDGYIESAGGINSVAGTAIDNKLKVVREYMMDTFDIDIDKLRSTILRREKEVVDGQVDLTSVEIY